MRDCPICWELWRNGQGASVCPPDCGCDCHARREIPAAFNGRRGGRP